MVNIDLSGKVALVTGGSRGIGRAISLALAACGADVVINYLNDEQAARDVVEHIQAQGRRALAVKANVGDAEEIERLFQVMRGQFDRLDIVISAAALGILRSALEVKPRLWQKVMQINAGALLCLAQCAVPLMKNSGGRLIALSSLGSTRVIPYYSVVGVSKSALEGIARNLAFELAPQGINVNVVCPGVVETDALKFFPNRDELIGYSRQRTPAGRLCSPEDVAKVVLFLVSPLAEMIHGQTIVVDGGYSVVA